MVEGNARISLINASGKSAESFESWLCNEWAGGQLEFLVTARIALQILWKFRMVIEYSRNRMEYSIERPRISKKISEKTY